MIRADLDLPHSILLPGLHRTVRPVDPMDCAEVPWMDTGHDEDREALNELDELVDEFEAFDAWLLPDTARDGTRRIGIYGGGRRLSSVSPARLPHMLPVYSQLLAGGGGYLHGTLGIDRDETGESRRIEGVSGTILWPYQLGFNPRRVQPGTQNLVDADRALAVRVPHVNTIEELRPAAMTIVAAMRTVMPTAVANCDSDSEGGVFTASDHSAVLEASIGVVDAAEAALIAESALAGREIIGDALDHLRRALDFGTGA